MRKDVIYIDVEDDITAVIDKLKHSKEKIIALVPPKGNAVLQSTVNLKLLQRAAKIGDKQPVIVTSNAALQALAGGLGMYVAKNLQSKPSLPSSEPLEEDDEDTVEVTEPVVDTAVGESVSLSAAEAPEIHSDELVENLGEDGAIEDQATKTKKPQKGKGKKVPNFDDFRKKLLIFSGIGVVLLLILLFFISRPKADIVVRAETSPVDIAYEATISDSGSSNPGSFTFRAQTQEEQKSVTQDFTPTGKKNVGDKANGSVTMSVCAASFSPPSSVPSGTTISSNGNQYVTTETAAFKTDSIGSGCINYSTNSVGVTASEGGKSYNVSSASFSVSGRSSISASGSASGGTDKTVTVVTQSDVNKAKEALAKKDDADIKKDLEEAFGDDVEVLSDSFSAKVGQVTSEPAVGQEANEGKLTAQITYTLLAVKKDDIRAANETAIQKEMDDKDRQQVYKDGLEDLQFEKIKLDGTRATYKISTVGQFGPRLDTQAIAEAVAKKKVGEVRSYIQALPGVKSTDINIAPFWSRSTPGTDKIKIKLEVDESIAGS